MCKFILIETSTQECSIALSYKDSIIALREIKEPKAHAKVIAPFIQEVLKEGKTSIEECSAVSVSEGPGSYTGLRVGVSTAKGICFGANLPLIGISTMEILTQMAIKQFQPDKGSVIIPMIDARRMEVYSGAFDYMGHCIADTSAVILDQNSYNELFNTYNSLIFIGDGVTKYKTIIPEESLSKCLFAECYPSVEGMATPTYNCWLNRDYKDTAYFEPFYLKDFIAGVSKKGLF